MSERERKRDIVSEREFREGANERERMREIE